MTTLPDGSCLATLHHCPLAMTRSHRLHVSAPATALALSVLTVLLLPPAAQAQTVYRCGSTYSQTPCPGAQVVEAHDARSASDKAQADATTREQAAKARALEQERQQREARAAREARTTSPASPPARAQARAEPKASAASAPSRSHEVTQRLEPAGRGKSRKGEPEYFTAQGAAPAQKKEAGSK